MFSNASAILLLFLEREVVYIEREVVYIGIG